MPPNEPYDPPRLCPNCGTRRYYPEDTVRRNGTTGCRYCFMIEVCSVCDTTTRDYSYRRTTGVRCQECKGLEVLPILPFDAVTPTELLGGTDHDAPITWGWELEMGVPRKNYLKVNQLLLKLSKQLDKKHGFCLKYDGSILRNVAVNLDGIELTCFEIVTRPFTWEWWKNNKSNFFDTFRECTTLGALSHKLESCGLHFHIGGLNRLQRAQLIHLTLNDTELPLILSRRRNTGYCAFESASFDDIYTLCEKDAAGRMNRYSAAHYSKHNTVELRYFRGTLNSGTFQALIEYTKALVDFVTTHKARNLKDLITHDNLLDFVVVNSKDYPVFVQYIKTKKVI